MYSKLLLIASVLLIAISVDAQSKLTKAEGWNKPMTMLKTTDAETGLPLNGYSLANDFEIQKSGDAETAIGETTYDLQTNSATQSRIVAHANGELSAVFTYSNSGDLGSADRGTGYNHFDGTEWGLKPDLRLESVRCGWPSISIDAAGNETVIAHANGTPNAISTMYKAAGGTWEEFNNAPVEGAVWPKSASNANTVHLVMLSEPVAFGGTAVNGIDGYPLYYRSSDGGKTFDISAMALPGLDSMFYSAIGGDGYNIAVNGDNVAIAMFESWGDMAVWKSEDNGATWTKTIALDFPLDGYVTDEFYTFDDVVSPDFDTLVYPDSLAIQTNDGSGAVVIDDNGMVHLTAGFMFVLDDAAAGADGNTNFYPGQSGMWYWNESLGADGAITMDAVTDVVLDLNGNDTIEVDATMIGTYFQSLTSYPTMGINGDGEVVVGFSSIVEGVTDYTTGNYFRHVYVTKTGDGGATWADPVDMLDSRITDPAFNEISECIMPSITSNSVDGYMHLVYQRDFTPGLAVNGDMHAFGANSIIHVPIPDDFNFISSTDELETVSGVNVYPNPTSGSMTLNFELVEKENVTITLNSMLGQRVQVLQEGVTVSGLYNRTFQLANLTPGLYFLEVRTGNGQVSTQKVMVQ